MEAKDTVLSNGKLLEIFGTPNFTERQGREKQAEITWQARDNEIAKELQSWLDLNLPLESAIRAFIDKLRNLEEWRIGEIETRKSLAEGHGITFANAQEAIKWLKEGVPTDLDDKKDEISS